MAMLIVSQNREILEQVRATLLEIDPTIPVHAITSVDALRLRLQEEVEGHVVLIDLHIDDGLGLDLAREITMSWPTAATLLLTTERGHHIYESALEVGARDVLPLPASLEAYSVKVAAARTWAQAVRHRVEGTAIEQQRQIGRVIAVVGAKGGVGASLVAVLLARELARGAPTCLIDLDLRNGDLAAYCGVRPRRSVVDLADVGESIGRRELDEASIPVRGGVMLLPAPRFGEAGELMGEPQIRRVIQATRYQYAFIVLDCGSRLDDVQAAALDFADEVLVVATPDIPALRAVRRLCEAMERLDIGRSTPISLVLNQVSRRAEIQPSAAGRLGGLDIGMEIPEADKLLEPPMNTATVLEHELAPVTRPMSQWIEGTHRAAPDPSRDTTVPDEIAPHRQDRRSRRQRRQRRRAGDRQRGQVAVETPIAFALVTMAILVCIHMVLWGLSHLVVSNAAEDAARYYAVGMPPGEVQARVAQDIPWAWGSGLEVGPPSGDRVTVSLAIPSMIDVPAVDATASIQWER